MKKFLALLLLVVAAPLLANDAVAEPFVLRGEWQQGSALIGKTAPGAQVWFNGRSLRVTSEGDFVFGLDRDAPPEAELKLLLPGATVPRVFPHEVKKREWDIQRIEGLPPAKVNPPAAELARIQREQALIRAAHAQDLERADFTQPMQWPATGRISGAFGGQRILNGEPKQPHYGVDVAVPIGTPVAAPAGGVIALAQPNLYYTGGTLIIDHGHGLSSIMVHLSKLLVQAGEVVKQGQIVAESGMTGRATGPHLHWGVYWFNARLDAQTLVPAMPAAASPAPSAP